MDFLSGYLFKLKNNYYKYMPNSPDELLINPQEELIDPIESVEEQTEKPSVDRIEALINTGHFENPEEAEKFLESLDETFEASVASDKGVEEFISKFEAMLEEAEIQVDSINKIGVGELTDKSEVFKDTLKTLVENFNEVEGILSGEEDITKQNFATRMGKFVQKHKAALVAFGAMKAMFMFGATDVEANDDIEGFDGGVGLIEVPDDVRAAMEGRFDDLDEIDAGPDAADIEEGDELVKTGLEQIKANIQEKMTEEGVMYSESSFSVESSADLISPVSETNFKADPLLEGLDDGESVVVHVQGYNEQTKDLQQKDNDFGDSSLSGRSTSIMERYDNSVFSEESIDSDDSSGVGESRDEAIEDALKHAAEFTGEIVTIERQAIDGGDIGKETTIHSVDTIVRVTGVDVQSEDIHYGDLDGDGKDDVRTRYVAKVNFDYQK